MPYRPQQDPPVWRNGYAPPPQGGGGPYNGGYPSPQNPDNRRQPPRSSKKRGGFLRVVLVLGLMAVLVVGVYGYTAYREIMRVEESETFYPGVNVDNYALGGVTLQNAYAFFSQRAQENLGSFQIRLTYGGQEWHIDAQTLDMLGKTDDAIREELTRAYMVGRSGNSLLERFQTIQALKKEPYEGYTANVEKNLDQIEPMLQEMALAVYRAPQDASFAFEPDSSSPLNFTPEQTGQTLDTDMLREQLKEMIVSMTSGDIQLTPTATTPEVTVASLQQQIALIGRAETEISTSSTEERNNNIRRGLSSFHGKTVPPGDKVSFNTWVGKRTVKNGFYEAAEIVRGNYEMGVGGGICQVSSTLYGAVVRANLQIVERRNHGIPVGYLDMGADATVSDGRIDFVFRNNSEASVYLVARLEEKGKTKKCVFEIYGRPDPNGYTYGMRHETIETLPVPEPEYIRDKNGEYVLFNDEEEMTFKGAEGYKVRTYRYTKDANGNVIAEEEWYTDTYKARAPVIYIGIQERWID